MITQKVLKTLEYDKILERLKKHAGSEKAKSDVALLVPSVDIKETERLLTETFEADKLMHEYALNLSFAFDDISFILERAEKASLLTMDEILKVGRVLKASRLVKAAVAKVDDGEILLLKQKTNAIFTDKALEDKIIHSIISPFEMSDNASFELKLIRQKIKRCNEEIRAKLNHFVTSAAYQKYLQDNVITVRDNRHVILVKSEFKGAIPGLIHGQSATGSTLYVEPMAVFDMNNKLKALLSDEEFEIERVLRAFSALITQSGGFIKYGFELMTELDIIFAKAAYAKSIRAVRPNINKKRYIDIVKGRHPLIDEKKVVPISLSVGRGFDILMITGPNTGGKTVTLKAAGLFCLMAQTGLFVPASPDTSLGVFDGIFSDIGDEQSIEQSLSTFSSHMLNIIGILNDFDKNSLLLLDELGAGTDPTEGAAIALAVTAHIKSVGAKAVITTHYNQLKEFSMTESGVENASMDFDPETFAPTYRLAVGIPGTSNAIKIAERLGLPSHIVKTAASLIGEDRRQFENIIVAAEKAKKKAESDLSSAERDRLEAEEELNKIKRERAAFDAERERFRQNLKGQTRIILENASDEAVEIIEEMKRLLKLSDEAALFEARRLKKRLAERAGEYADDADCGRGEKQNAEIIKEDGQISVGDLVFISSLRAKGRVSGLSKTGALVDIGGIKTRLSVGDIYKIKDLSQNNRTADKAVNLSKPIELQAAPSEINLIGKNIDEALYYLDGFIDRAVTGGLGEVRIIHGVGTGKLGRAIQQYLKGHRNTAEFRYGKYGEGERGVTILRLK
ncbi:MAG: endonuclease MutS2 [Clostridiales bacterium]|nr:endonuclease MutS2 [Clostridiales bacterium]